MKTILLIITLMYNAFLFGQMKVDKPVGKNDWNFIITHSQVHPFRDTIPEKKDTVWIHTSSFDSVVWKGGSGTIEVKEQVHNDTVTTFPIQNMDSIIKLCKDSNWSTYIVRGVQVYPFLRPTIKHNYMLFDEMGKDTIPKWYIHIAGTTLTSNPPCYSCLMCGKVFHSIGETGCIPNEKFDSVTIQGNEEPVYHRKRDTVLVEAFVTDTFYRPHAPSYSLKLYSVRELHNLNEIGLFNGAFIPRNYHDSDFDYWQHLYYLDRYKEPLQKNIIVWQTKEIE